ncbi:MAG: spore cortex biosynthesis protein YabQ [Alicyclobacillus sp.]|nr:spore cortex biosynthesis protein YabQ [Alicyclobacillus sp.]
MTQQAVYVVLLVVLGGCMGAVFDVYNTVLGSTKWFRWLRPAVDVVFWVVSACGLYFLALKCDAGRLRLYTFLLVALGYALYQLTAHDAVVASAFRIVRFIQRMVNALLRVVNILVWRPLSALLRLLLRGLRAVYWLACRLEDGLFWTLRLVMGRMLYHWLCRFPGVAPIFRATQKLWEDFWNRTSKWLATTWLGL